MVMSDKIKANRQALEYYKVAQELLALATSDASDFIDDYEDTDITGQQFKRESSGWVSHLDDIIEDLKGKPDPLNLLPKATALRKQLGQVSSQPADDISYDMQHAAGTPAQSKERFWNKISNMFDSIVSEEPAIVRAPRDGSLDVFEQPKAGYANQRQANTRRDTVTAPNIPDKPNQSLTPRRRQQESNQFVRPRYDQKVESPTERVIEKETQLEKPAVVIRPKVEEKKSDFKQRIEQQLARERELELAKATTQNTQVINVDQILSSAKKAAKELEDYYDDMANKSKAIVSGMIVDAGNMQSNLEPLINSLGIIESHTTSAGLGGMRRDIVSSINAAISGYNGTDLLKNGDDPNFNTNYGSRIIGGVALNELIQNIQGEFDELSKYAEGKDPALKQKNVYGKQDVKATQAVVAKILEHVEALHHSLELISNPTVAIGLATNYEGRVAQQFKAIASELNNKNSEVSKLYLNSGMFPSEGGDDNDFKSSIEALRKKLNNDSEESLRDEIVDRQIRPYHAQGKWKESAESDKSFKAKQQPRQIANLINMIEDDIESPFEHDKVSDFGDHATSLYAELDKAAQILEQDSSTSRAAGSINKLKNKLLKVARNTALALQPEFKGEIIAASQNAVQQLDLIVVEQKPVYANQRQANLVKDKPKVSNIPDKPKQQIGRQGIQEKNEFQKQSLYTSREVQGTEAQTEAGEFPGVKDLIVTIAIELIQDVTKQSNDPKVQPEYFKSIFVRAKTDISESLLNIKKNFSLIVQIAHNDNDAGPHGGVYDSVNRDVLSIIASIQSLVTNVQLNRHAISMMDDKIRKDLDKNLRFLSEYNDALEKHLEHFKDADFSEEGSANEWTSTLSGIIKNVLASLNRVMQALISIGDGYDDLISQLRSFVTEISRGGQTLEDFVSEYPYPNTREDVKDDILKYIGSKSSNIKSFIKSFVTYHEKTYRLGIR